MQRTYNYIPEKTPVFMVHNVAPILPLQFMVRAVSFPIFCLLLLHNQSITRLLVAYNLRGRT